MLISIKDTIVIEMDTSAKIAKFSKVTHKIPKQKTAYHEYSPAIPTTVASLIQNDTLRHMNIERGGCIFYTFLNNKLYFCFGRDNKSSELTDFGGTKKRNNREDIIRCALREGDEETRCAFALGGLNVNNIKNHIVLYNNYMLIIFIYVTPDVGTDIFKVTSQRFLDCSNLPSYVDKNNLSCKYKEVSQLEWLDEDKFAMCLETRSTIPMFSKVKRFLRSFVPNGENIIKVYKNLLVPYNILCT